uniref:Coenzyme PQQ synthesis protein F-like C-terminal lobe domain-containing protein n=1 Tax=Entomoneis paludosa TaxID=265537 RepID=A0A7S2YNV8_9STRA
MGIMFRVVSNVKSASQIVDRIDQFLVEFRQDTLEKMTDDQFLEHLVAVSTQKLEMFNSMPEETDVYWDEIVNGRFSWQAWRDEAIHLRTITKKEAIAAYDEWLLPGQKRKIMAVQVIGGGTTEVADGRPDVDPSAFGTYADQQVGHFHQLCKNQSWGRINSKLA